MRLTISTLFEADEDDSLLDFTTMADFKEPPGVRLNDYIQSNPGVISFVEETIGVKFAVSYEDPEEVFMSVEEGPLDNIEDVPDMLLQTIESFIVNLNKVGFHCMSKTSMVTETFPENIEVETPKQYLN